MTSYAQKGEDLVLWSALKDIGVGFYVDVGAWHPEHNSVTKAFYELGWRGINVEPDPAMYALLCKERPGDLNYEVAAGARRGIATFYRYENRGLYPLDPIVREPLEKAGIKGELVEVIQDTLWSLLRNIPVIHFLKIDVEGYEAEVLRGMDFKIHRPWILVIEATRPHTEIRTDDQWKTIVEHAGYLSAGFDGLNVFYVAAEHRELIDAMRSGNSQLSW